MLRFAANINTGFKEYPFYERFQKAADLGFGAIELPSPFVFDVEEVVRAAKASGVKVVQFNFADGDMPAGERGMASHPARQAEWRDSLAQAIALAQRLNARQINSLAGCVLPDVPRAEQLAYLVENLKWAMPHLAKATLPMMLEALNPFDNKGYLLTHTAEAIDVIQRVGSPWLKFQYDVYHMQRTEGELVNTIRANIAHIGHVQIADNPGRHQPGTGEINYRFVLGALEAAGYEGYVGLEYLPDPDTARGLGWLPRDRRVTATAADLVL